MSDLNERIPTERAWVQDSAPPLASAADYIIDPDFGFAPAVMRTAPSGTNLEMARLADRPVNEVSKKVRKRVRERTATNKLKGFESYEWMLNSRVIAERIDSGQNSVEQALTIAPWVGGIDGIGISKRRWVVLSVITRTGLNYGLTNNQFLSHGVVDVLLKTLDPYLEANERHDHALITMASSYESDGKLETNYSVLLDPQSLSPEEFIGFLNEILPDRPPASRN